MSMPFPDSIWRQAVAALSPALQAFNKRYPGDNGERQPVHTMYGGAQLYKAGRIRKISELAVAHWQTYAPDAATLARALGADPRDSMWETVHARVQERLKVCAVEDYRIDFEDGYGHRPDAEEDATAEETASEVSKDLQQGALPPFFGIRIKSFSAELHQRAARTLGLFVAALLRASRGKLPPQFVITLPKVVLPEQVGALVLLLEYLEREHALPAGTLRLEIMIETTPAVLDCDGGIPLLRFVAAAKGRCRGAHFGTYDYTASCDITAAHQQMDHPACDFALQVMKVAYAGTGLWLSTGATSVMPVAVHPGARDTLSAAQLQENQKSVHQAWRTSYRHITQSLVNGFYQGWDLHPGQLGVRYAACYAFFLSGLPAASTRLKNFIEKAAQATLVGDVFDDAATGQGLLNYFLRALSAGAITEDDVKATGLTLPEVRSKSFLAILAGRRS